MLIWPINSVESHSFQTPTDPLFLHLCTSVPWAKPTIILDSFPIQTTAFSILSSKTTQDIVSLPSFPELGFPARADKKKPQKFVLKDLVAQPFILPQTNFPHSLPSRWGYPQTYLSNPQNSIPPSDPSTTVNLT